MTPPPAGTPWWGWALVAVAIVTIPSLIAYLGARSARKTVERVEAQTAVVAHEVRPNSGGSLADAVHRIEAGQQRLEDGQRRHDSEIRGIRKAQSQQTDALARLDERVEGRDGEQRRQHAALARRLDEHLGTTT